MEKKKLAYFTKYLPVEGDIKDGDTFSFLAYIGRKPTGKRHGAIFRKSDNSPIWESPDKERFQPMKSELFLCTRDIQVGDKARHNKFLREDFEITSIEMGSGENYYPKETLVWSHSGGNVHLWRPASECFKVVGRVSPEALSYVKEGMEFNEDEVQLWWYYYNIDLITDEVFAGLREAQLCDGRRQTFDHQKYKPLYKIKGPCGHFH